MSTTSLNTHCLYCTDNIPAKPFIDPKGWAYCNLGCFNKMINQQDKSVAILDDSESLTIADFQAWQECHISDMQQAFARINWELADSKEELRQYKEGFNQVLAVLENYERQINKLRNDMALHTHRKNKRVNQLKVPIKKGESPPLDDYYCDSCDSWCQNNDGTETSLCCESSVYQLINVSEEVS